MPNSAENLRSSVICLFDVDGTITDPRQVRRTQSSSGVLSSLPSLMTRFRWFLEHQAQHGGVPRAPQAEGDRGPRGRLRSGQDRRANRWRTRQVTITRLTTRLLFTLLVRFQPWPSTTTCSRRTDLWRTRTVSSSSKRYPVSGSASLRSLFRGFSCIFVTQEHHQIHRRGEAAKVPQLLHGLHVQDRAALQKVGVLTTA